VIGLVVAIPDAGQVGGELHGDRHQRQVVHRLAVEVVRCVRGRSCYLPPMSVPS
jgi:hypothetical protein